MIERLKSASSVKRLDAYGKMEDNKDSDDVVPII